MHLRLAASALLTALLTSLPVFATPQGYTVKLDGMVCADCVKTVTMALDKIPMVDKGTVKVVLKKQMATLTVGDENKDVAAQIKKAIEDAGYTVVSVNKI